MYGVQFNNPNNVCISQEHAYNVLFYKEWNSNAQLDRVKIWLAEQWNSYQKIYTDTYLRGS